MVSTLVAKWSFYAFYQVALENLSYMIFVSLENLQGHQMGTSSSVKHYLQ